MTAGIYEILNTVNGKRYIGQAANFKERWKGHRKYLRNNRHHNPKLQCAWNKYGLAAFQFRPLLLCSLANLTFYEQLIMDALRPEYNIAKVAGSPFAGRTHSDATREKMSRSHTGVIRGPFSPQARANIDAGRIGKKHSLAARKKMSDTRKGRRTKPLSQAHRDAISKTKCGKPWSPARRAAFERKKLL